MPIRLRGILGLLAMLIGSPMPATGQETHYVGLTETNFVGLYQGSDLTDIAEGLAYGGYELSDGTRVSFDHWYHSDWVDTRFEMLTQFSDDFGVLWGASTGQRAPKVRINPSLKLGIILQRQPTPSTTLSLTVSTILGGNLNELPCTADYGAIGGVQTVNCRLAASPLPPAETLKYLKKDAPSRLTLRLQFKARF
jgi:hypothetical protein